MRRSRTIRTVSNDAERADKISLIQTILIDHVKYSQYYVFRYRWRCAAYRLVRDPNGQAYIVDPQIVPESLKHKMRPNPARATAVIIYWSAESRNVFANKYKCGVYCWLISLISTKTSDV